MPASARLNARIATNSAVIRGGFHATRSIPWLRVMCPVDRPFTSCGIVWRITHWSVTMPDGSK